MTAPPSARSPRRIVFLGPPGAGKGTQASTLAQDAGILHLSTGDLLRSAVAEGSELGRAADGHMRAGRLVPDDLVLGILRERLARRDAAQPASGSSRNNFCPAWLHRRAFLCTP